MNTIEAIDRIERSQLPVRPPRILMLGWEFPPHISGGLGTACHGLTTSLSSLGVHIDFIVPSLQGGEKNFENMRIYDPASLLVAAQEESDDFDFEILRTIRFPSLLSPYLSVPTYADSLKRIGESALSLPVINPSPVHYGSNLFDEVQRYSQSILAWAMSALNHRAQGSTYDLVHAHDWMTYPAATALAGLLKLPLVVHAHSLEYDRSGAHPNFDIQRIEEEGLRKADRVIAVSHYTRSLIHEKYQIPLEKIEVVHNGINLGSELSVKPVPKSSDSKLVLFLGRITFQKGPDYFVEAAALVIEQMPQVRFAMVGSGDMLPQMIERTKQLGIFEYFEFPGHLRGEEVNRMFANADVYVMPSVSEPFGLTALESILNRTPVIVSRQAGVSEVMQHVFKVDFWDVQQLANFIIGLISYPELKDDMISMATEEVSRVQWSDSANKTLELYKNFLIRS